MSQAQTHLPVQSMVANDDMTSLPSTPAAFSSPYFPKDDTPFTITTSLMESDNDTSPCIPDRSSSRHRRHKQHQVELDNSPIQGKNTEDVLGQLLTTPDAIITDTPSDSQDSSHRYLRRTGRSTVLSHRNVKIHQIPSKQHVKKTSSVNSAHKPQDKEYELPETPKISKKRILGQISPTSSPNAVHNLESSKEVGSGSISISSFYSTPLSRHKDEMRSEESPSYTRKRHIRSRGRITHRSRAWRRPISSVTLEIPKLGRLTPVKRPPTAQEIDESIARMVAFHNWLKPTATPPIPKSAKELNNDTQEKEKNKKEKFKDLLKRWFRRRKLSFGWPAPNGSESLPRLELLPVINEKNGKTRLEPFPKGSVPALDGYLENEESRTPVASVAGSIGDINDKVDGYPVSRNQAHTYDTDDHGSVPSVLNFNSCLDDKGTSIDKCVDECGCGPLGDILAASGGLDDEVVMAL